MRKLARILPLLFASIATIALANCAEEKKSNKASTVGIRQIKGDPMVFVKGTAMNGLRPIPSEILSEGSQWQLYMNGFFDEPAEVLTFKEAEVDQTPGNQKGTRQYPLNFNTRKAGGRLLLEGRTVNQTFSLTFTADNYGGWILIELTTKDQKSQLGETDKVLHTSISRNRDAFNFLIYSNDPAGRALMSLTFTRRNNVNAVAQIGNTAYEYLFGAGKKIGWSKSRVLNLTLCGDLPASARSHMLNAHKLWSDALKDRLQLTTTHEKVCPPFSDLNTQTYSYVSDWVEIVGELGRVGLAGYVLHADRQELIDGDSFFLMSELREGAQKYLAGKSVSDRELIESSDYTPTIFGTTVHEIGHILGLHHKIEGPQSIMSYRNYKEVKLYDYDIKAIQHLYE